MMCVAQLPKRSVPDHSVCEDEYREWSDEDESGLANDAHQVMTTNTLVYIMCDLPEMLSFLFLQAALFPQVVAAIQHAIAALGGAVVPKLNWSCPKVLCCFAVHPTSIPFDSSGPVHVFL